MPRAKEKAIPKTTGNGIGLTFNFAMGSTYHGADDTWETGSAYATSNQVNWLDSTSNNFYITNKAWSSSYIEFGFFGNFFPMILWKIFNIQTNIKTGRRNIVNQILYKLFSSFYCWVKLYKHKRISI